MKVLWFSPTPSLFNPKTNSHNGGGWVASLERIMQQEPSIQLGVAFEFPSNSEKYQKTKATYYTIDSRRGLKFSKVAEQQKLRRCLYIIKDFNPDIIQIFGSETYFGRICEYTRIPVIIHMQGSMPPYLNALFPQAMNKSDFIFTRGLSLKNRFIGLRSESSFYRRSMIEIQTLKNCNYFMGRTEWDKNLIKLFHPSAKYYHVEEALRDSFIKGDTKWEYPSMNSFGYQLISVISDPWYKGFDLILKTAKLLKEQLNINFEWKVYGFKLYKFFEHKYGIKSADVDVKIMGTASKEQLVNALCSSSCYIHPSYIDNSPNSVCEAQILGVPVIATNVGGISSIVSDGRTGLLIPSNDPFTLSVDIMKVISDKELSEKLSAEEIEIAEKRHNPESIKKSIINTYLDVLRDN